MTFVGIASIISYCVAIIQFVCLFICCDSSNRVSVAPLPSVILG